MLLDEIGVKVTGAVASLTRATNCFEGDMPDDPANCVAIMEYSGPAPDHDLGTGVIRLENATFQVVVRNQTFATGRALVQSIHEVLVGIENESLSGTRYQTVMSLNSTPTTFPRDADNRWRWSMNYQAAKDPS